MTKSATKKKIPHRLMIGLVGSSISKIMQTKELEFGEAFDVFIKNSKSSADWDYNAVKDQIQGKALKKQVQCAGCKEEEKEKPKGKKAQIAEVPNLSSIPKNVQFADAIGYDGKGKAIKTEKGTIYERTGIRKFSIECPPGSVGQVNPENENQGFCKITKAPKPE